MIEHPDRFISAFADAGADQLTVHAEACPHLHRTVHLIKEHGIRAGVALNPHTPVSLVEWLLPDIDLVLIMTVNPGFGGQAFIARTMEKVEAVARRVADLGLPVDVQVDGGIDVTTAPLARKAEQTFSWPVRRFSASPTQRLLGGSCKRPSAMRPPGRGEFYICDMQFILDTICKTIDKLPAGWVYWPRRQSTRGCSPNQ